MAPPIAWSQWEGVTTAKATTTKPSQLSVASVVKHHSLDLDLRSGPTDSAGPGLLLSRRRTERFTMRNLWNLLILGEFSAASSWSISRKLTHQQQKVEFLFTESFSLRNKDI